MTQRRDLEDRIKHLSFHRTDHPDPFRRCQVLLIKLLHHRLTARCFKLYDQYCCCKEVRRSGGSCRDRSSRHIHRTGTSLRCFRQMEQISLLSDQAKNKDSAYHHAVICLSLYFCISLHIFTFQFFQQFLRSFYYI